MDFMTSTPPTMGSDGESLDGNKQSTPYPREISQVRLSWHRVTPRQITEKSLHSPATSDIGLLPEILGYSVRWRSRRTGKRSPSFTVTGFTVKIATARVGEMAQNTTS